MSSFLEFSDQHIRALDRDAESFIKREMIRSGPTSWNEASGILEAEGKYIEVSRRSVRAVVT